MGKKALAIACVALASWSQPSMSEPDYESGNSWQQRCQSPDEVPLSSCMWFVYGFNQGIIAQSAGTETPKPYCLPGSVTIGQVKDVWVKYMQNNPAERHKPGGVLLMVSMMKAFPCTKGSK